MMDIYFITLLLQGTRKKLRAPEQPVKISDIFNEHVTSSDCMLLQLKRNKMIIDL